MPPRLKVATLVEVAKAAGVSVSTAGRVLRDADYHVDPALGERVREAAARLGYVANVLARSLRGGTPGLVGLIVGDMLDPYYAEIAEAVTQHAESTHGLLALVCNMQRDPLLEIKYCRQLWEHRVAGLVLAGGGFDQWTHLGQLSALITQMQRAGVRIATLSPRNLNAPTFSTNNESVGRLLANSVVAKGHQAVGVLIGPPQSEVTQQRLRGITTVLTQAQVRLTVSHGEYLPASGEQGTANLLNADREITALLVGSDAMAQGALKQLGNMGRRVPEDISVVSIGNTGHLSPSGLKLTTVDVGLAQCGKSALDYIANPAHGVVPMVDPWFYEPSLVMGNTLSAPSGVL